MAEYSEGLPRGETEGTNLRESILEAASEVEPKMLEVFKDLHEHPELGGQEVRTAQKVVARLKELGIEIAGEKIGGLRGKEGTGVIGRIYGKEGGPTIALRADMDALPVHENDSYNPRSKDEGVMHACGHDGHTAGLLGAAEIMKKMADHGELPGDVLLMFQPSEEKAHEKESGAVRMIRFMEKAGLRKDIAAFFGLHVRSDFERGQVRLKEGVQMASSGEVDITLTGPGGHIINSYDKDNPNLHLMFSEITLRLAEVFKPLAQRKEALVASARTRYEGTGYNVLPAAAESTWVVRVASPLYKKITADIIDQIREVVSEVVQAHGGAEKVGVKTIPRHGYRPVIHRDPELVAIAVDAARKIVPDYQRSEELDMGGEDFAYYLEGLRGREIPGVFLMVGAADSKKGIPPVAHHTPAFRFDQGVIKDLAALHTAFTLEAMKHFSKKSPSPRGRGLG